MLRVFVFSVFLVALSAYSEPQSHSKFRGSQSMKLEVISDYGSKTNVVSKEATAQIINDTMRSLNWNRFHQVVLTQGNGDLTEVGGSLNPSDGLSVMYQENNQQFVIKSPPTSVDEMTAFLLGYVARSHNWKRKHEWHR
jgi:hypothetical protein